MGQAKRFPYAIEVIAVFFILTILALVMIPKFLDAQIRSQIARAQQDLKLIGEALILYSKDHGQYPGNNLKDPDEELQVLTTPIAYLNSMPLDTFRRKEYEIFTSEVLEDEMSSFASYSYSRFNLPPGSFGGERAAVLQIWYLISPGPDFDEDAAFVPSGTKENYFYYAPSNGVLSNGDIVRSSYDCDASLRFPTPTPSFWANPNFYVK